MKVIVFESNLLWSSRFKQTLGGLGHEAVFLAKIPACADGASVAIVNLAQPVPEPKSLITALRALGVKVIAHAGHKEKELLELGRDAQADILATNSEITAKLPELLERVTA